MGATKIAVVGLGGVAQLVHLPILSKIKDGGRGLLQELSPPL